MSKGGLSVVGVIACLALAASSPAQGLGDAAKKEKTRRAESSTPAKTYTDEDLEGLPPIANVSEDAIPAPPAATPARRTAGATSSKSASRGEGEAVWRGRVNGARARVEKARAAYEKAKSMYLVPGYEYVDERNRPVIRSAEELQKLTARAKAELEAAERDLADLLERARRAGVPPGWLR
jgi:hypothetical protein